MDLPLRCLLPLALTLLLLAYSASGLDLVKFTESDTNPVYSPCGDTTVQVGDGFTFGLAINSNASFYDKGIQYSPCDQRLNLSSGQLTLFRPKVDEISLLTINESFLDLSNTEAVLVAFAGSKNAAVSFPHVLTSQQYIITNFTLILDFTKGQLQNLLWNTDGCSSCQGNVCLNNQYCAIPLKNCKTQGGTVDCSLSFQTFFSGLDKHDKVLNSWYEISSLNKYSLFQLYDNSKNLLTSL